MANFLCIYELRPISSYLDQKSLKNKGSNNGQTEKFFLWDQCGKSQLDKTGPSARVANQNTGFASLACSWIQLYDNAELLLLYFH